MFDCKSKARVGFRKYVEWLLSLFLFLALSTQLLQRSFYSYIFLRFLLITAEARAFVRETRGGRTRGLATLVLINSRPLLLLQPLLEKLRGPFIPWSTLRSRPEVFPFPLSLLHWSCSNCNTMAPIYPFPIFLKIGGTFVRSFKFLWLARKIFKRGNRAQLYYPR